jgi:2,4-dienoyl-CoA reductase (NADPH2)
VGAGLGKTTGWIHRTNLTKRGVKMMAGVSYKKIDDIGLHITVGGESKTLVVDNIIICAGQEPERRLANELPNAHLIGGADIAAELDARRAIDQGTRLALEI